MSVFLNGLKLQFYRGIGEEVQIMHPFTRFNFFVGANNSGKSTVLNFIGKHLSGFPNARVSELETLERHYGPKSGTLSVSVAIPRELLSNRIKARFKQDFDRFLRGYHRENPLETLEKILSFYDESGVIWASISFSEKRLKFEKQLDPRIARTLASETEWFNLWTVVTQFVSGGNFESGWFPNSFTALQDQLELRLPKAGTIPAIREIGPKGHEYSDLSGKGLIDQLAALQNPALGRESDFSYFDKINAFLKDVTAEPTAQIHIPHDREHVLVEMNGKRLPLLALGTGIHEVIMIAAACIISENMMICIEEPELHLHPILQRKLISYIEEHTSNQYFVATHSAAFIDTPNAGVFHVSNDGNLTRIRETILRQDRFNVCVDLGYRASDILQANSVIWVEGPSDRIYINHWIGALDRELRENIHYAIMFYGGRLLSHLTGDDVGGADEVAQFISLVYLNRNSAIVIDSDKKSKTHDINATKLRIKAEFTGLNAPAWITAGREIENYIPYELLQQAVKDTHPLLYHEKHKSGQFQHVLHFKDSSDSVVKQVDKVKVAANVCKTPPDLAPYDLRDRITEIVAFIRKANGL